MATIRIFYKRILVAQQLYNLKIVAVICDAEYLKTFEKHSSAMNHEAAIGRPGAALFIFRRKICYIRASAAALKNNAKAAQPERNNHIQPNQRYKTAIQK